MNEKIEDKVAFILRKRETLLKELESLRSKTDEVRAELNSINNHIRLLQQLGFPKGMLPETVMPRTVSDMALQLLLKHHPRPLKAMDILEKIQAKWDPTLVRTSLSPPLSRLKHKGLVELRSNHWGLTEMGYEKAKRIAKNLTPNFTEDFN